ncbi:D-serine ammonia-lyase [Alicyclobacillus sp. SO9]|nr:D-serine ammonia-lyase [Alicyclobacillus sp. SO9]
MAGKTVAEWKREHPLLDFIQSSQEVLWLNPRWLPAAQVLPSLSVSRAEVVDAEQRLLRFAPYIQRAFPETIVDGGLIESPLRAICEMQEGMQREFDTDIVGPMLLKLDSELKISGSIKARGGIYEVLKIAERLAFAADMLEAHTDYSVLANPSFRKHFSQYRIVVGSTGNLGLSIGIMGAKLGFQVSVHMSTEAKQWKKDKLRSLGVEVVEHSSDYTQAVQAGRREAQASDNIFFVDDDHSRDLFLGYAVAASRLQGQLERLQVSIGPHHPLVVYLPCGVGGGPGGIAFGLKLLYGDSVHIYFVEPTHSPSMLLGLMTGQHDAVSVQDFGLDNHTAADGLAVGRPSRFVGRVMDHLIDGIYTVSDERLYQLLSLLQDSEQIAVEPSAAAGLFGPVVLHRSGKPDFGDSRFRQLQSVLHSSTHLVWATGGSMVPRDVMRDDYNRGQMLRN